MSSQQQVALLALCGGKSVSEAARLAEVDRSTLYRWARTDPVYIAALNAWRTHTAECARDRVLTIAEDATRTIAEAVRGGDVRASLAILKGLGTLSPATAGPTTALAAARTLQRDKAREDLVLLQDRIKIHDEHRSAAYSVLNASVLEEDRQLVKEHGEK